MKSLSRLAKGLGIAAYVLCAALILMFLTPVGGWKALDVLTGSMRPSIQPGDLVFIHSVPLSDIHVGDVVTYRVPNDVQATVTHRVISIVKLNGVTMITVKGDANKVADAPFAGGFIVGKVEGKVPAVGRYINYLHNPYGLALIVILPGLFIIWTEIERLRVELRKHPKRSKNTADSLPSEMEVPAAEAVQVQDASEAEPASAKAEPPARQMRSLDGMKRLVLVGLAVAGLAMGVGHTLAASVGAVTLASNSFTVAGAGVPSPTPTPCAREGARVDGDGDCDNDHLATPTPSPSVKPCTPAHSEDTNCCDKTDGDGDCDNDDFSTPTPSPSASPELSDKHDEHSLLSQLLSLL